MFLILGNDSCPGHLPGAFGNETAWVLRPLGLDSFIMNPQCLVPCVGSEADGIFYRSSEQSMYFMFLDSSPASKCCLPGQLHYLRIFGEGLTHLTRKPSQWAFNILTVFVFFDLFIYLFIYLFLFSFNGANIKAQIHIVLKIETIF